MRQNGRYPTAKMAFLKIPNNKNIIGQFLRYFVTGGLAFIVDFGVFALSLYYFEIHYLACHLYPSHLYYIIYRYYRKYNKVYSNTLPFWLIP